MKHLTLLAVSVLLFKFEGRGQKFEPDTTINNILNIEDYRSIEQSLGDIMEKLNHAAPLPDVYYTNSLSNLYLRLVFFPGSTRNSFSRFEIGIKPAGKKYEMLTQFNDFGPESGISIGDSMKSVIEIKGSSYKKYRNAGVTVLFYEISDMSGNHFLQRYNMPGYSAKYYFRNGKLFKMSLGFDYP